MSPRHQLPTVLARLPAEGVNAKVFQTRWLRKGLPSPTTASPTAVSDGCYWDVKKVELRPSTSTGKSATKAYGVFYWKGKRITPDDKLEPIKGALKYDWTAAGFPKELARDWNAISSEQSTDT